MHEIKIKMNFDQGKDGEAIGITVMLVVLVCCVCLWVFCLVFFNIKAYI